MKKFFIWSGWQTEKRPLVWGSGVYLLCYGLTFLVSGIWVIPSNLTVAAIASILIAVLPFGIISIFILAIYGSKKTNWRIAVDEAWKFAKENKLEYQSDFLHAFDKTKETKDPTAVNEWIEGHEKWQNAVKKMKQLEKDKEELPQRIANTAIEIRTHWKKIFS